jgi:YhcH/YjgK/YiaL family protein
MVLDKIENCKLYSGLGVKVAKAFAYIMGTDLTNVESGKYEIDDGDVYALVQEYETKDRSEGKLEGHRKYIDVQYIISGTELIGITSLTNQVPVSQSEEDDYALYECDSDFIRLDQGKFAIFFPDDLHMPGISVNQASRIRKVVVKVRI